MSEKKTGCRKCQNDKSQQAEQTKENIKKQSESYGSVSMIKGFAMSLTSRGLKNKKTSKATKQLRVLSCFGNQHLNGELPPCEHLKESITDGEYYCGGCGCGDRKGTWLTSDNNSYSKLDYPKLNCPLQMPGFTNYSPSSPDESEDPVTRRNYIETVDYVTISEIPVSTPEMPEDIKNMLKSDNS
mgnify:FL=1